MSKEQEVSELCQPVIESLGLELVGVQYHHNSVNPILRIYLDKAGGISMDDIVLATEQLNPLLDVSDPIGSFYTLEVSSPGLDRPLFSLADFEKFLGAPVKVQLRTPVEKRRRFEGLISAVDRASGQIQLTWRDGKEDRQVSFAYDQVEKARLVPVFAD